MYVLEQIWDLDNVGMDSEVKLYKDFGPALDAARELKDEHLKEWYEGDSDKAENFDEEILFSLETGELSYKAVVQGDNCNYYRVTVREIDFEENQTQGGKDDE